MNILKQCLIAGVFLFGITGCKQQNTYSYFVQHPAELQKAVEDCQTSADKSAEEASQCQVVMSAATNFMAMENDMQQDPEKFGEKVLDAQAEKMTTEQDLQIAQQTVNTLQAQHAAAADIQTAQTKLIKLQHDYHQQQEDVMTMLAVIGVNSPE